MSKRFQVDPFDLLGQAELYPPHIFLPGTVQPKLEIAWNSFHQNFFSGVPVFFQRARYSKAIPLTFVFRDCRVERSIPRRAIFAALLLHVAFVIFPWPQLPLAPRHNAAFDNTELTWSGPIQNLPLLDIPRQKPKSLPKNAPDGPLPVEGADAYHPRQRIYTDPVHPTHPRQTLINSVAPPEAPKILPPTPNIVQLGAAQAPERPHLEISEQSLARLKPRETKKVAMVETSAPDLPNVEQRPADVSIAAAPAGPAKPKLQINTGSAPRVAARAQEGETAAAPEVPAVSAAGEASNTLIALSANPAPPAPVVPVPQGNLAARVLISPEGKPGATGSSPNSAAGGNGGSSGSGSSTAGKNNIGISISGGDPKTNANASGLGGASKLTMPKSTSGLKRPDPNATIEDPPERTGPPNFATLPPGAKPEDIFSTKRVYSMNVNMPNFNSATGSWIIHFSELHLDGRANHASNVSSPVPVRKVDPKYSEFMRQERIEGEVILYAVIRPDGTVDSIQLVRGIDEKLDANAMSAFSQWKFEPATKEGQPVALEAIVHIPFRIPERR
jgi:TonB family protein